MSDLRYWIWLTTLKGLSLTGQRRVLEYFGSPREIFLADGSAFDEVGGLAKKEKDALRSKDMRRADGVIEDCRRLGIRIMTCADEIYPQRLWSITTAPLVLYYKGNMLKFDELPAIAVVGSRNASSYGRFAAQKIGYQIGLCGGTVISGAAMGIDTEALTGAMKAGGPVAAVLGNGLDIVYPAGAEKLYADILARGCLISEYVPGTAPLGQNFPRRNRLMSGLSLGVVVAEATKKSGSLITAELALEQGRDVFAVPGNIGLEICEGSNALIQDGAKLITCGWDVMTEYKELYPEKIRLRKGGDSMRVTMKPVQVTEKPAPAEPEKSPEKLPEPPRKAPAAEQKSENLIDNGKNTNYIDLQQAKSTMTGDEQAIVTALMDGRRYVDDIIAISGLSPAKVLASLTLLEVKGYVTQLPGKIFELNLN